MAGDRELPSVSVVGTEVESYPTGKGRYRPESWESRRVGTPRVSRVQHKDVWLDGRRRKPRALVAFAGDDDSRDSRLEARALDIRGITFV